MSRPNSLASLSMGAIDQLEQLITSQLLIKIALEQFEQQQGESFDRADLILRAYLSKSENYFQELRIALVRIRLMVGGIGEDLIEP